MEETRGRQLRSTEKKDLADLNGLEMSGKSKENAQLLDEMKKLNCKIDNMTDNMRKMQDAFEKQIEKKIDRIESSLKKSITDNHTAIRADLEKHGRDIKDTLDIEVGRLQSRMDALEGRINSTGGLPKVRFDPDVSIIVAGLPREAEENISEKVKMLLVNGLGVKVDIADAIRLDGRGDQPGLVKIECISREEKIAILRQKNKLKDHPEYGKVYVRSAKSHTDRLIEINFKTLLREIPNGKDFFITGNGRLVRRGREREETGATGGDRGGRRGTQQERNGRAWREDRSYQSREYHRGSGRYRRHSDGSAARDRRGDWSGFDRREKDGNRNQNDNRLAERGDEEAWPALGAGVSSLPLGQNKENAVQATA